MFESLVHASSQCPRPLAIPGRVVQLLSYCHFVPVLNKIFMCMIQCEVSVGLT